MLICNILLAKALRHPNGRGREQLERLARSLRIPSRRKDGELVSAVAGEIRRLSIVDALARARGAA